MPAWLAGQADADELNCFGLGSQLNVKNTTLEQRMIANGVFGTLNEAWNAFKP